MDNTVNQLIVDLELIRRLDKNGPRYTSYPTADRFVEAFNAETVRAMGGQDAKLAASAVRCRCMSIFRSATRCVFTVPATRS